MKKPQYNLSSSKRLHEPERQKLVALSIMPKRSLNSDVDAWVASGGVITQSKTATQVRQFAFEITPEGKPKIEYNTNNNLAPMPKTAQRMEDIMRAMMTADKPLSVMHISEMLGFSRVSVQFHVKKLMHIKAIRLHECGGRIQLYVISK